jgi:periplasmic protein TonB
LSENSYISDDVGAILSMSRRRTSIVAIAASIVTHGVAVLLIVVLAARVEPAPSYYVLAYLVGNPGGDAGAASSGPGASSMRVVAKAGGTPALLRKSRRSSEVGPAARRSSAAVAAIRLASAALGDLSPGPSPKARPERSRGDGEGGQPAGAIASGSPFPSLGKGVRGLGSGDPGGSGAGGSDAHALYGESPPPAYPERARLENQQGTVMLRVLVGADGSVERIEIAQSSGFDALDRAATDVVRTRWRFVPAKRAGATVASWVIVPIRFTLMEG